MSISAVLGMDDEEVWRLVRRWDKETYVLKKTSDKNTRKYDLRVSRSAQFAPNKLRGQMERYYINIAYIVAWYFDYLGLFFVATLATLAILPQSRPVLFPPTPLALYDFHTGTLRKPLSGVLGSADTFTGAPEHLAGEAVENEASNFIAGKFAIFFDLLVEKDSHDLLEGENDEPLGDDENNSFAESVFTAKDRLFGVEKPSHDKTKAPMSEAVWESRMQMLKALRAMSDLWERSANLLSPPSPIDDGSFRRRLIKVFVPLAIASVTITPYIFVKIFTFAVGLLFFGGPLVNNHIAYCLNPNNDQPFGATPEDLSSAAAPNPSVVAHSGGSDAEIVRTTAHGKTRPSRALETLRSGVKAAIKISVAVDKVKAKAGHKAAKARMGEVTSGKEGGYSSPSLYEARFEGRKGFVYIQEPTPSSLATVSFVTGPVLEDLSATTHGRHDGEVMWRVVVRDIVKLVKHSGYGPTAINSKVVSTWATGRQVKDGLEIVDGDGTTWRLGAVEGRDRLFNRLCALGGQKWEVE
ncbi:hypothetical protein N0V90_007722 [Kalmusia sp. IMI 367209]|nr:hypothetical protein N0V90_007722 [Kalmusia sp. IMI 367209]